jgi:hypothetical protein
MTRTWKIIIVVIALVFVAGMVGGLVAAFGGATSGTSGPQVSTLVSFYRLG